ncbi:hypothetical protein EVA_20842 [gut metagenome]|uniref:Uncharacterized protein n=1 Tax=gut metagenome TaxID=749906 RepID=J9F9F7_9ZZZZ
MRTKPAWKSLSENTATLTWACRLSVLRLRAARRVLSFIKRK